MRVIAGEAKGRSLRVPRGLAVRPSASRLRESTFGMLDHRGAVAGARVLDLFAGAGGLGIEALSRGAASLVAVEQSAAVARVLADNLARCGFAARSQVVVLPVAKALARLSGDAPFDLVLLDPPYRSGCAGEILEALAERALVAPAGLVVVETARGEELGDVRAFDVVLVRRQGDGQVTLLASRPGATDEPEVTAHAPL